MIETSAFQTFWPSRKQASVAISRWVESGKLVPLRRGHYLLGPKFRRQEPALEKIANLLVEPSYLSLEWALSFHGLIPEAVFTLTSVTTNRPSVHDTPLGTFRFRHVSQSLFWGYELQGGPSSALIACPEKALLDFFYFQTGPFPPERLEAFRFQNTQIIDRSRLRTFASRMGKPRLIALADQLIDFFDEIEQEG